jgi:hypothetical protein
VWRGRFGHQFLSPALGARTAAGGEFEGTQFDAWSWLPMELKNMGKMLEKTWEKCWKKHGKTVGKW